MSSLTKNTLKAKKYGYRFQKAWKENNRQAYLDQQKEYRNKPCNTTKTKIRQAIYRSSPEGKAKRAEYERRRVYLKKASSVFLTEENLEEIKKIYLEAERLTRLTGVEYQVDHIVPLKGKTVTGLHVPWNLQIIQKSENLSKNNSYDDWGGY